MEWLVALCAIILFALGSNGAPLDDKCTCTAARLDYWSRYNDILVMDPVKHYRMWAASQTWNCFLCESGTPVYLEDDVCHCDAVNQDFIQRKPAASPDAWAWIQANPSDYTPFHPELCPGSVSSNIPLPDPAILEPRCTCLAARQDYWDRYSDIYRADYDAVWHYVFLEYPLAGHWRTWNCSKCDVDPIYINDTISTQCPQAKSAYSAKYAGILGTYYDPFYHYASTYLTTGSIWKHNLCDFTPQLSTTTAGSALTTGGFSSTTTGSAAGTGTTGPSRPVGSTPIVNPLPFQCTCMAARLFYWSRYSDVRVMDPVKHYEWYTDPKKPATFREWRCELCQEGTTVFLEDEVVHCQAAQDDYKTRVPAAAADPWGYFWNNPDVYHPWHGELCEGAMSNNIPLPPARLTPQCTCVQAREEYWVQFPEVKNALYDAVFHYWLLPSYRTWECAFCNYNPVYINHTAYSKCPAAVNAYKALYGTSMALQFYFDPFYHYAATYLYLGSIWRTDLCTPPPSNSTTTGSTGPGSTTGTTSGGSGGTTLPYNCTCMAARLDYWARNPDTIVMDPVKHYVRYDTSRGWNCYLCQEGAVYIEDEVAQCDAAKNAYIKLVPSAVNYGDAFLYWQNRESATDPWHGELCEGAMSNYLPLPSNKTRLDPKCTCIAARHDYWNRYPDVYTKNSDPIWHYITFPSYRTWDCSLCNVNPQYMNDTVARCPAAVAAYNESITISINFVFDPFYYYMASYMTIGKIWHSDYCTGNFTPVVSFPPPTKIPASCSCLNARLHYWMEFNDVLNAGYDPVSHYEMYGHATTSFHFECNRCTNGPVYINDTVARCTAAKAQYNSDYRNELSGLPDPFIHYANNYLTSANHVWHAESCEGAVKKGADWQDKIGANCICIQSMLDYTRRYPSTAGQDPIYHYNKIGFERNYEWDCQLCQGSQVVYRDSDVCRTCAPAKEKYLADPKATRLGAGFYFDPWLHYWNEYMSTGLTWSCELCVNVTLPTLPPTTGGSTTGGTPQILPDSCKCLQAMNDYVARYPDVRVMQMDPVKHWESSGYLHQPSRQWKCGLCDHNPIILEDHCNCPEAQERFMSDYPNVDTTPSQAFQYYLSDTTGMMWRCNLCPSLPLSPLAEECTCAAARADYLSRYPEAQAKSPYYSDPVYYHRYIGGSRGNTWNCDLCQAAPTRYEDSVCNCGEAATQYGADYSMVPQITNNRYNDYISNYRTYGMVWKCDMCSNTHARPSTSLTCNCTAARNLYESTYSLEGVDPWVHYTATGNVEGKLWDCAICNDTCHGTFGDSSKWVYPGQSLSFSASATITVPPGCHIPLPSQSLSLATLTVRGSVRCSPDSDIALTAQKISVYGSLECGSEAHPHTGNLAMTLVGSRPVGGRSEPGGVKGIAVFDGGVLSLHGAKTISWTRLSATVAAGSTQIQTGAVDWEAGDRIIIATTESYGSSSTSEVRTISSIEGNTITLTEPLTYSHESTQYDLPFDTQTAPLSLLRQAEVGLLTGYNIQIKGDETSTSSQYGAHVTALAGSRVFVSGVEISLAGQQDNTTSYRYPFQWEGVSDASGQYFKNSCVRNTYFGCVGTKQTSGALISRNVCFNFVGNGYVIDDAISDENEFDGNLGITMATGNKTVGDVPLFETGIFVFKNPTNTIRNNVAVGSSGSGFWLQINKASANFPWEEFNNNMAHSSYLGYSSCAGTGEKGFIGNATQWTISQLSVYGSVFGIWPCGTAQNFENAVLAEVYVGFQSYTPHKISNGAFVSRLGTTHPHPTAAIRLLDSGWELKNVLFRNFDQSPSYVAIVPLTAGSYSTATRMSGISVQNSPALYADPKNSTFYRGYVGQWGASVYDADGTLTGTPGVAATLVTNHPMMRDNTCRKLEGDFGYACPHRYMETKVEFGNVGLPIAAIGRKYVGVKRADTSTPSAIYFPDPTNTYYQWSSMVNTDYVYTFLMPLTMQEMTTISMPNSRSGDSIALEFSNVNFASGFSGASQASSCSEVYASKTTQSYYFSFSENILCVRLVATTLVAPGQELAYSSTIYASVLAGSSIEGQPPPPYMDGPNTIPQTCTCMGAMEAYWNRYPEVSRDICPIYHYQEIGAAAGYAWNCVPCEKEPHYVTENYCRNCTAARENYTATYDGVEGVYDPYDHYLLYHLSEGYAFHCELCPAPLPPDAAHPIRHVSVGLKAGLGAICGGALLMALFAAMMLAMRYDAYASHGSFYSGVIIVGATLSFASAIVLLPDPTDTLCMIFPWLLGAGFTLVYGCLFIKTWALYKVWQNAEKFKRTSMTPTTILKGIGLDLIIEFAVLIIWTIIDPPKAELHDMVNDTRVLQCTTKHPTFWIIFLAIKGVWLVFGAGISILTRNVVHEYNQSKSIAYAIYNIFALLILAVPLATALRDTPGGMLIIEVGVIVIAFTFTLMSLFFNVWHGIFFPSKTMIQSKLTPISRVTMSTNSATTKDSPTTHSSGKSSSHSSS